MGPTRKSPPGGLLGSATSGLLLFFALFISLVIATPLVSENSLEDGSLEERALAKRVVNIPSVSEALSHISLPENQALFYSFNSLDGDTETVENFGNAQNPRLISMEDAFGSYMRPNRSPLRQILADDARAGNEDASDRFIRVCSRAFAIKVAQESTHTYAMLSRTGWHPDSHWAKDELI